MSIQESAPEPIQEMLERIIDGKFTFACHPGVPCFTECCRDLKLLLTPYDVIRLKHRLDMDAETFVDRHATVLPDEQRHLPMVYLEMRDDARKTCPFVSPRGCTVYEDRPAACRIYPVARASRKHRLHGTVIEDYFILHEPHCKGFEQTRNWTIDEWVGDQGLDSYHEFNNLWMEIITHPRLREGTPLSPQQQQMFFLASYNLDRFRDFVLKSRFLQLFELEDAEVEAVRTNDEALLRLSFRWLNFSLLNVPAMTLRKPA